MREDLEKVLEFDKIKKSLSNFAFSDDAKEMCLNLKPYDGFLKSKENLSKTNDAYLYLIKNFDFSFSSLKNNEDILKRLEKNMSLNIDEILSLKKILDITKTTYDTYKNSDINNSLNSIFDELKTLNNVLIKISSIISKEGNIYDNASLVLQNLRRKKILLNNRLLDLENKLLNKYKNYLQEPIIANKNGKQCLIVKSEYKNYINGYVQDISSTGFSIYIEPKEIIEIDNEIKNLESLENVEIEKILLELSNFLVEYIPIFRSNTKNLINLDFIFAKANFALSNKYSMPIINNDKYIKLISARHPLIDKNVVVPLDLEIGKDYKTLIITGPNTGGKTVCLKIIGLIHMMALSGLFIPARENSYVSFFDDIFVDIGDEQSIEMSLSTFSSHMVNIIDIVNNANENSLCLFDEICTGTDPVEGANLAISILRYLMNKKSLVIATTHYPELKIFALSQKGIINGSFEFDIRTLKPTYKLLIGLPGKSNAFLISERLGLNKEIIKKAKEMMNQNDVRFEDVILNLEERKKVISKEEEEIKNLKSEIVELKEKILRQQKGLDERTSSMIRKAKEEARSILLDAKEFYDKSIKEINNKDINDMVSNRSVINKKLNTISESMIEKTKGPAQPLSPKKIFIGSKVKILSMNATGFVETLPDKDYNLFIRVGILRIKSNLKDLELVKEDTINVDSDNIKITKNRNSNSKIKIEKTMNITNSINLIGKTTDEAIMLLDKYLDDCYISHLNKVYVIHGRGTGALKNAIHKFLKKQNFVKDFYHADFNEGGDGATIVEFN